MGQEGKDRLELALPLSLDGFQFFQDIRLGHTNTPGCPAIRKVHLVKRIKIAENRVRAEVDRRNHSDMLPAQSRLNAPVERRVIKHHLVKEHGLFRHGKLPVIGRNCRMQIGQRFMLIQKLRGNPQAFEYLIEFHNCFIEVVQGIFGIHITVLSALYHHFPDALLTILWRHPVQGIVEGGFKVIASGEEVAALHIYPLGDGVREVIILRVRGRRSALCLKVHHPAGFHAPDCLLQNPCGNGHFFLDRRIKVGATVTPCGHKAAILADSYSQFRTASRRRELYDSGKGHHIFQALLVALE